MELGYSLLQVIEYTSLSLLIQHILCDQALLAKGTEFKLNFFISF